MISPTTIDQIKALDIVEVVSKYVTDLKKLNADSYRAKSPFTNENSPSFYVKPSKNIFKCFSTGKGGDGITFVMEKFSLAYIDALKTMCVDFGIQIEYEDNGLTKEHYDELEMLYKINLSTAGVYNRCLLEVDANHPAFIELINKRRFSPDTIAQWQIGFAPGEVGNEYTPGKWNHLYNILKNKGFYKEGIELKLIKTKGEVTYDTLRNRITYPILDHNGRCVSFGGRALHVDKYNAKYINGENSKIYDKSKVLFGLHFAGNAIRKRGFANLMEGYTDVISFHQAGQINSVGTCGTALTEDQAKLLKKYTNKVVLFNDPDEAGQNSSSRAIDILMKHGFETSVVPLPSIVQLKPLNADKQPWRERVFITQRSKESIWFTHYPDGKKAEMQIDLSLVAEIEKVDPDELVRMFAA